MKTEHLFLNFVIGFFLGIIANNLWDLYAKKWFATIKNGSLPLEKEREVQIVQNKSGRCAIRKFSMSQMRFVYMNLGCHTHWVDLGDSEYVWPCWRGREEVESALKKYLETSVWDR